LWPGTKRGGVKGLVTKKKIFFKAPKTPKKVWLLSSRGGGVNLLGHLLVNIEKAISHLVL